MRILAIVPSIALLYLPAVAFSQTVGAPTSGAIIAALHQQLIDESDELTLADARLLDMQKTLSEVEAELQEATSKSSDQNKSASQRSK